MKSIIYWYPESYEKVFEDSLQDTNVLPAMQKFAQKNLMQKAKDAKNVLDREFIKIDNIDKKINEKILDKIKITHAKSITATKPFSSYKKMKINLGLFVYQYLTFYYKLGIMIKPNEESFENTVQSILDEAFMQEISRLNELFFDSENSKENESAEDNNDNNVEEEAAIAEAAITEKEKPEN